MNCDDVRRLTGSDKKCCYSCHSEWEDGYGYPLDYTMPNGEIALVCCAISDLAEGLENGTIVPIYDEPEWPEVEDTFVRV